MITQAAINQVLGRDARDKYKFDIAFTYARNKLTELRTEERRKVHEDYFNDGVLG